MAGQMTVADLYNFCTSHSETDKTACRFYILGVFEGAQMLADTVLDGSGKFREAKEKPFCMQELTSSGMEVMIRMRMGEDLALFPDDRDMPAVAFITATIVKQFPCKKAK